MLLGTLGIDFVGFNDFDVFDGVMEFTINDVIVRYFVKSFFKEVSSQCSLLHTTFVHNNNDQIYSITGNNLITKTS